MGSRVYSPLAKCINSVATTRCLLRKTVSKGLPALATQTPQIPCRVQYASQAQRVEFPSGVVEVDRQPRKWTPSERRFKQPRLIVFDKDGTLISFHSAWSPWVHSLAQRLEAETGLKLEDDLFEKLNVCNFTKKARSGILAHGTTWQIKRALEKLLCSKGVPLRQAQMVVENTWQDCDTSNPEVLKAVADLKAIFDKLKAQEIKIAVCTSDNRNVAERTLETLGILPYVDKLVCGNDLDTLPKPSGHNVLMICEALNVSPSETVVVGDTRADVKMGKHARVGMTVGVLSGIGTRLDLAKYSDYILESVNDIMPLVSNKDTVYKEDASPQSKALTVSPKETAVVQVEKKASLVIFDKDGTLICFHSMWTPWAQGLVQRLEKETGLELYRKVLTELGYCHQTQQWTPGLLAEATTVQNKAQISSLLQKEGLTASETDDVISKVWRDGHGYASSEVKTLDDLAALFRTLKSTGVKVAICTADSRASTEGFIKSHNLEGYVDMVVCGDDPQTVPKPSAHNALKICSALGVNPAEAVVVGDTNADLGMGRSAKLGATVGVLSGVGRVSDLEHMADHLVHSIQDLLPIVLEEQESEGK